MRSGKHARRCEPRRCRADAFLRLHTRGLADQGRTGRSESTIAASGDCNSGGWCAAFRC